MHIILLFRLFSPDKSPVKSNWRAGLLVDLPVRGGDPSPLVPFGYL